MKTLLSLVASVALIAPATAQITEITAPTLPGGQVDPDNVAAAGSTFTVADFNAAATGGSVNVLDIQMPLSGAAAGVYSTNTAQGNAIAAEPGTQLPYIVDTGAFSTFDAFNLDMTLGGPSTEMGLGVGDWIGPVIIDFYDNGTLVANFTSTTYSTGAAKYFQSSAAFNEVFVQGSTSSANWCITDSWIQTTSTDPFLAVTQGAPGGLMDFAMYNFTAGETIFMLYGPAVAPYTANAPCGTVDLELNPLNYPAPAITETADANGAAQIIGRYVPPQAVGITVQAVGGTSCGSSNAIVL